jgi:dTDP-4-amino-4,6-dideoxygalactose transaminase
MQAAILNAKLKYLDEFNKLRKTKAHIYNELLSELETVIIPDEDYIRDSVFHLYVIRILNKKRDYVHNYLKKRGISTIIHYPMPLHLQPAYKILNYKKGDFPLSEKAAKEVLSLPLYPWISEKSILKVVANLKAALKNN